MKYQLVPRELTPEMIGAVDCSSVDELKKLYKCLLAFSPSPPEMPELLVEEVLSIIKANAQAYLIVETQHDDRDRDIIRDAAVSHSSCRKAASAIIAKLGEKT
jgi:hypothetical protein